MVIISGVPIFRIFTVSIVLYMYLFCIKLAIFQIIFGNPVQNRYTFFVPIKMYQFCTFFRYGGGGHLEFSTTLNFIILKPWSLIMLHMNFKIHGCSGLRE